MTTFLGIYRGHSIKTARLVAVSADPWLIAEVATAILTDDPDPDDPVLDPLAQGRRQALQAIGRECVGASADG